MGPAGRWGLGERRLYLCTPDRPDLAGFVDACIEGGVDIVQLREKHLADGPLVDRASLVQQVCRDHGVPFILNDRPDLAAAVGADGVHVGQDDIPPVEARRTVGDEAIIGLSTHATDELTDAIDGPAAAVVDYLSAGPVSATPTKPGRPGTGLAYIGEAARRAPRSVWVTGGVDPDTVGSMIATGASHFVVVRWLTESDDPRADARRLRRTIDDGLADFAVGTVGDDPADPC